MQARLRGPFSKIMWFCADGTVLPIGFQAVNVDPAIATGPLVTTIIDVLGIASYLLLAAWLLAP